MVRIAMINSFFVCSTRSSDGTHPKFDFEDPEQCTPCEGFNPFAEEPIPGEELENDSEPSADSEDEEKDDEQDKDNSNGDTTGRFKAMKGGDNADEDNKEEEGEKKSYIMTRQQKLDKIRQKIVDWIDSCKPNLFDTKLEKDAVKYKEKEDGEEVTVDDTMYAIEDLFRWNHSKCELHYADGEE